MSRPLLLALLALAAGAAAPTPAGADERDREARRAAIVAGAVREHRLERRAEERYEDCRRGSGYDEYCERRRYEDERRAHIAARRTAIVVGSERRY